MFVEKCEQATNNPEYTQQDTCNEQVKQLIDANRDLLKYFNKQNTQLDELVSSMAKKTYTDAFLK